jgi:hypothetical protein
LSRDQPEEEAFGGRSHRNSVKVSNLKRMLSGLGRTASQVADAATSESASSYSQSSMSTSHSSHFIELQRMEEDSLSSKKRKMVLESSAAGSQSS